MGRRRARGFTLLEGMIAVAMIAVVASLALPSFGAMAERARLKAAAETLAADLQEARFEAAKRGAPLHVELQAGPAWCWAVAVRSGCGCGVRDGCQLKTVQARDHGGIGLVESSPVRFEPVGTAVGAGGAVFRSTRGEMLKVALSPLGRASICAPGSAVPGYGGC